MDFDMDDPLGDLLSDGSNDSFFEEPKVKRGSLTKTPEKKSISDLFGLEENKEEPKKLEPKDDWLGLGSATKKNLPVRATPPAKSAKKISFEDDDDILGSLGLEKKPEPKSLPAENLQPAKLDAGKKSALLESILGAPSKPPEEKLRPRTEPIKSMQQRQPEQPFGFSSLDAPREGRRKPALNVKDPLGLFSSEAQIEPEKKPEPSTSVQASPIKKRDVPKTPDWLGMPAGSGNTEGNKTEVLFTHAEDMRTKSVPNLSTLPQWLSNEPIKTHKSDIGINRIEEPPKNHPSNDLVADRENATMDSILTQQKLATSHMEYQNTSIVLQQQESQILMALQLKKYEENMLDMQRKQQDVLVKQELQFNGLLERQFAKQQILENNMRLQQERINNHIQMLISQPPVTPLPQSSEKIEELKNANAEEMTKLYENLIESLKQRHHEELFLVEESYKKQFTTMEQSAEAVEARLKAEVAAVSERNAMRSESQQKEHEAEVARYQEKLEEMSKQHQSEVAQIRENHNRVVEEIRHEYASMVENIKQTKQLEKSILENATSYSEKLDVNLEMLGLNSKILTDMREKVQRDYGVLSMAREESLKAKEEEIKMMRVTLEKARGAADADRAQLMGLVRSLEMKLVEQTQDSKEERWAMQQAAATLTARSAALDRESDFNRNSLECEREQLKTLKESLLAEQQRVLVQLTDEKLSLSAEKSKLETSLKLNQSYDSKKSRAEIDAAVQIAREAAEMTDREREQLHRQQSEMELLRRNLVDRERKLEHKERELSSLLQNAERKARDGERALAEAKSLESSYNERLRGIQNQLSSLTTREKKLAEEKIALSKERLLLNNALRQTKKCSLCAVEESSRKDEEEDFMPFHVEHDRPRTINIIDPELLRLRMEINESRDKFLDNQDNSSQ